MHNTDPKASDDILVRCTRVAQVGSFEEMIRTPFSEAVNVVLQRRALEGYYAGLAQELAERFPVEKGGSKILMLPQIEEIARTLRGASAAAADTIMIDLVATRNLSQSSSSYLRLLRAGGYDKVKQVYGFHGDGSETLDPFYQILCPYTEETTEGINNEDAVNIFPEQQIQFFSAKEGAEVFRMRCGDIWKQACVHKNMIADPFIHRAPAARDTDSLRLLLVGRIVP